MKTPTMKEIKKQIMNHIANADSEEAFELAIEHFPGLGKELSILKGNYVRLKKKHTAGALSFDQFNIGISEVSFNLIELMSQTDGDTSEEVKKTNPLKRLVTFQMDFLKGVISDFSRSKIILGATLIFIVIVGITSIIKIGDLMPSMLGKVMLSVILLAFFTLIISALGFLNVQIKQFKGSKSFLKFQEYSEPES